jgi:hypothetical protein
MYHVSLLLPNLPELLPNPVWTIIFFQSFQIRFGLSCFPAAEIFIQSYHIRAELSCFPAAATSSMGIKSGLDYHLSLLL